MWAVRSRRPPLHAPPSGLEFVFDKLWAGGEFGGSAPARNKKHARPMGFHVNHGLVL
jgi:hypothetical protein